MGVILGLFADGDRGDAHALALSKRALQNGDDLYFKKDYPATYRAFLYMPLMHSEDLEDQRRCVDLFTTYGPERNLEYARTHMDAIYLCGRFPGRHTALGRETPPEEAAFLATGHGNW